MRRRVTVGIAFGALSACTLLTDLDGLSGGREASVDAGDSGSTNDAFVEAEAAAGDGGSPEAAADAADAADGGGCRDELLVGDRTLEGKITDVIGSPFIDTYGYTASSTGTARCVWFYLEEAWDGVVVAGVYGDTSASPSTFLAEASSPNGVQGWNALVLSQPVPVTASTTYWIGLSSLKTGLPNRVKSSASCASGFFLRVGSATGTNHAPNPFPAGAAPDQNHCEMAAFLSPAN